MARRCATCPHSIGGSPNPLSDNCDGCRSEPNTGWFGSTDNSIDPDSDDDEDENKW